MFSPPVEHIEFPLSNAEMKALKEMSDPDVEMKKKIYDRSLESGVLPYDIDIDAFPEDTPVAPPRHVYTTFSRLLEHGCTKGCPGCDGGHYRHSKACRERFDAIFPREAAAPPTPAPDVGAPKRQSLLNSLALEAVQVEEFALTFTIPTFGGLALVVYVGDLILLGPSQWHEPFWETLGEKVLIDDIGPLGRFHGRHHSTVEVDSTEFSGPRTSFPLAWLSKKQTATCRSTTEAETVALSYVLLKEGLPLVELYSAMLERPVLLRLREDNTTRAKVVTAGYSKKLRHLKRVHRVSLSSVKEQLDRDDVERSLVGTSDQKADVFTKAVEPALAQNPPKPWSAPRWLLHQTHLRHRPEVGQTDGIAARRTNDRHSDRNPGHDRPYPARVQEAAEIQAEESTAQPFRHSWTDRDSELIPSQRAARGGRRNPSARTITRR